ncbi:MAG: fibronectin type III domain-containing protein [Streptosporangiaceae bacterium]|jgi:hypothetical protein
MSWLSALKLTFPADTRDGPRRHRRLKGPINVVAVISVSVTLAACSSGGGGNGGGGSGGVVRTVCQILQTDTAASAAVDLLKKISDDTWEGGLATDLVISAVQESCDSLLSRAVDVVQRFFSTNPNPRQTNVAEVANFQNLSSLADDDIAAQLDQLGFQASSDAVATLVNDLCQDLHGSRESTPVQDVQSLLPNADLQSLPALNGVTAQVTRTCTPLNNYQADGLVSGIYQYLVSNESLAAAPLVITSLTWSWVSEGTIDVNWSASYSGVQFDLWVSTDGQWKELLAGTGQTSTQVNSLLEGHLYEFAVRADANGSVSPFSYMYPCLTCTV